MVIKEAQVTPWGAWGAGTLGQMTWITAECKAELRSGGTLEY